MKAIRKEVESDLIIDVFFTNMIRGKDGNSPYVGENLNWWIAGRDTGVRARGVSPNIGKNFHWWVDGVDTGVVARGQDGKTPSIDSNGNWEIGGVNTGVASNGIPVGVIVMWSGSIDKIPNGWALCSGDRILSNGDMTPDLRGRFIVGYDNNSNSSNHKDYKTMRKKGGEDRVTLSLEGIPPHSHMLNHAGVGGCRSGDSTDYGVRSYDDIRDFEAVVRSSETGFGMPHENRPPFYVLAYIIKL